MLWKFLLLLLFASSSLCMHKSESLDETRARKRNHRAQATYGHYRKFQPDEHETFEEYRERADLPKETAEDYEERRKIIQVHIIVERKLNGTYTGMEYYEGIRHNSFFDDEGLKTTLFALTKYPANYKHLGKQKILRLKNCSITNAGAVALAEFLKTDKKIEFIDLQNNKITAKGCLVIANALRRNNSLHGIFLDSANEIGKRTIKRILRALEKNPRIEVFSFNYADGCHEEQEAITNVLVRNLKMTQWWRKHGFAFFSLRNEKKIGNFFELCDDVRNVILDALVEKIH